MMTFIKIAWRNIIRNKKRSLITISAIGFGLGALIFIWAFVDGSHAQMVENYTSLTTSHIQIHKKGFQQKQQLETNIENPQEITRTLLTNPHVKSFTQRVKAFGLVSSSEHSSGVFIVGINPDTETKVSSLHKRVKTGAFLGQKDDKDIIIGKTLAKNLNVELEDKIVIMSQGLDGSIAAGAFYIKGLFDSGVEEVDKGLAIITHKAAEELFVMEGKTSEVAIRLKTADEVPAALSDLKSLLHLLDIEILPWEEVSPMLKQWIEFDEAFVWVMVLVIMVVVAIGILNTVLMGVLERTREFGILIALGTKNNQVITMVAWESLFLGFIGTAFGLFIGLSLSLYTNKVGIDLTIFTDALNSFYMDAIIYPILHSGHVIISSALVLLTSIIVSIYPAWYASKLDPIEAIRKI